MWDILIKGGRLIDGTGKDAFVGDLAIEDGVIAKIAPNLSGNTRRTVDAGGLYVSPGFIDMHSHGDCTAYLCPDMEGYLAQGVTTLFTGHCAMSLAPVDKYWLPMMDEFRAACHVLGEQDGLKPGYPDLVETEELIPEIKACYGVDVNWRTHEEYMRHLERGGIGANMLCLLGHSQLRHQILGYDVRRAAADKEIERMCGLLRRELDGGAAGLSFGLDYTPGVYADTGELVALGRVVAEYGGILAAHTRAANPGYMGNNLGLGPIDGVRELLEIGLETGAHVHISHIPPPSVNGSDETLRAGAHQTLELIRQYRARGVSASFDVISVYGMFSFRELAEKMTPYVARCGGKRRFAEKLKDISYKNHLAAEIKAGRHVSNSQIVRVDPTKEPNWAESMKVARCAAREYEGLTIAEIAAQTGQDPVDTMMALLSADIDTCCVPTRNCYVHTDAAHELFLAQEEACVGFDGAAYDFDFEDACYDLPRHHGAPATYSGAVTYLLAHRDKRLEDNIKRLTGNSARALGLRRRGFLAEGMAADILVFDHAALDDRLDMANPRTAPKGIELVIVNGVVAVEKGVHTHVRTGRILRRDQIHAPLGLLEAGHATALK